jgi:uncharacterized cupin superfamily protein
MASVLLFDSSAKYINQASTLVDRLNRIEAIIDALYTVALTAAAGDNIGEYFINDGQVQIKTTYKSSADIEKSIIAYERLKEMLKNQLNGRGVRLMDGKNFI